MEQGSSASALAARTAGMTDEQILDLDLEQFSAESAPQASAAQDDMAILDATSLAAEARPDFFKPGKGRDAHGLSGLDKRCDYAWQI